MQHFLDLPPAQRAAVFTETAARLQLHPTPIEKDFWVCWLLRELFTLPSIRDHLIFKGGTSLSKGYGLIKRFSEDIDLSIDATAFGIEIESDRTTLSASQRDNRIKRIYRVAREFIARSVLPELDAIQRRQVLTLDKITGSRARLMDAQTAANRACRSVLSHY